MKKILWQLFALVALVGAGYSLLKAYPGLMEKEEEVWVPPQVQITSQVEPGTYVLFQTTRVIDRGAKDWANDDTTSTELMRYPLAGSATPTLITEVDADETFGGSPWAEVVGQSVWFHRFTATSDAFVELDGSSSDFDSTGGTRVANRDGSVWVDYAIDYDGNSGTTLSMNVQNNKQLDNNLGVVHAEIDQATFGIDLGYGQPYMISDDGSTVYIRQICDCDAVGLTGLWAYDVVTQKLRSITALSKKGIHEYEINPATNQLIGASWTPANSLGEMPYGPSVLFLVDLKRDGGRILQSEPDDSVVLGHPHLSDDGTQYSFDLYEGIIRTATVGKPNTNYWATTSGRLLDWIGDDMILDRDGTLLIYNTITKTEVPLAASVTDYNDPNYLGWQYVGVIDQEFKL